jgi:glycosyl hydrolase family 106( putative alpha-L-rhamnosidase)
MKTLLASVCCLICLMFARPTFAADDTASLQQAFDQPADNARINVRWWWYGPAVTKPMLQHEMETMKAGGIGGFEVQPTYPLSVDGELPGVHNIKFLSPEFFDMLNFTAAKARELGLRMDLTMGSGWPYGGPMFTKSEGAGRILEQVAHPAAGATSVKTPRPLVEGQTLFAAIALPRGGDINAATAKVLTIEGGAAQIPADIAGPVDVHFYISGRTGMMVKRPAMGAEGPVIDHLSDTVVAKFIKEVAEPEINACGDNPPHSIFCDSLEVGGEDWTDNFMDEFQVRRGYDLRPLLPALFNSNFPRALDIRHDWGRTLTELFNDHFNKSMTALAHAHHTLFREQAYGSPSAAQFSYADVDLPEGETPNWHQFAPTRYAASATHLMGVPVASSETFTWLHSPVFRATPLDMKAEANLHFLQGVNQIVCHGWPSTAPGVSYPGWSFYAAAVFNDKNPWFIAMPDVARYLQRVSSMMRQGKPANDVAFYIADSDAWAHFTPGNIALTSMVGRYMGNAVGTVLDAGYNLDFFDDGMLDRLGKVDGSALSFGDVKYKVVVLAGVQRIPVSTMRQLEALAKAGGTVVAMYALPSLAPGYLATDADTQEVRDIATRLFTGPAAPGIFVKNDDQFARLLAKRLAPDVALSPASPDVAAVHRHADGGDVYFVANTSNQPRKVNATFRVEGMNAEEWDPMTGQIKPVAIIDRPSGGATIALNLAPYGSTLIVWTNRSLPAAAAPALARAPRALDLSTDWTVTFGNNGYDPSNLAPVTMDQLRSWTDDPNTKNFSGVATYEKKVTIPANLTAPGLQVTMTFGDGKPLPYTGGRMHAEIDSPVHEAAVVYIDDKRIGSVWAPPYSLDLTGALTDGDHTIRIQVGNLAINYMAGHGFPNYDLQAVRAKFGNRFDPQDVQDLQPITAGLMGPIRIEAK